MMGILGNHNGKVKPWYLPFDWVFCRITIDLQSRVVIVKNNCVSNIYGLAVKINNGVVVGIWHFTMPTTSRKKLYK
jgi:hypothetical protein